MNVLVIAAHPDDEVLGAGGTINRLASEGHQVYITILGEGATSRYSDPDDTDQKELDSLQHDAHQAAKTLGAKELFLYQFPDNRFDSVPLLEIIKVVEGLIEKLSPELIFTHFGGDLNIDHRVTCEAVLTATRPTADSTVRDVYLFEVPSSTEWAFNSIGPGFAPNLFIDISDTLQPKLTAMTQYRSESREFPHPRSIKALESIAFRWGSCCGCEAAEAFQVVRIVRKKGSIL